MFPKPSGRVKPLTILSSGWERGYELIFDRRDVELVRKQMQNFQWNPDNASLSVPDKLRLMVVPQAS